jgi:4-amino-4-deoxy-L-arabinose transferase-like glycosyltransferase
MAIVIAVFYLTREISDTRTALLAALLWTCYLPAIRLYYSEISGDLFATLGVTIGLFFFARAQKMNRNGQWLTSGFLFGLAILSRSAVLIVVATLTVVLWDHSCAAMDNSKYDRL